MTRSDSEERGKKKKKKREAIAERGPMEDGDGLDMQEVTERLRERRL